MKIMFATAAATILYASTALLTSSCRRGVVSAWAHVVHHHHHHRHHPSSIISIRTESFKMSSRTSRRFMTSSPATDNKKAAGTSTGSRSSSSSSSSSSSAEKAEAEDPQPLVVVHNRLSRPNDDMSINFQTLSLQLPLVLSHLQARRCDPETLEAAKTVASLAQERITMIQQRDAFLAQRREASATVGKLLSQQQQQQQVDNVEELEKAKAVSTRAAESAAKVEAELEQIQGTMDELISGIPNLLDDIVPDGKDESDNEEIYKWGDVTALPRKLGWTTTTETTTTKNDTFVPLWHDDVALQLGGYQAEAAVKLSGARFVALSGAVAQLERALGNFMVDLHTNVHGYTEVSVPLVVSRSALEGTSQLPKFQDDLFAISQTSHTCNGQDAFLIPTAEVPLTNLHANQVLDESQLPLSYVAWTPCFRAEAGSYGRDTRGLIRQHQFEKVELVRIATPPTSRALHEELTHHAERCLQLLELPYRKVRLCSGDVGFAAQHCYDLEVWLPGAGEYREISSCSNTGDFQARRMSLRYRPSVVAASEDDDTGGDKDASSSSNSGGKKKKKMKKPKNPKPQLCHTINGSGLAVGRTLVAVLENYQRPDGSVVVPDVLRPYMGGKEVLQVPTTSTTS